MYTASRYSKWKNSAVLQLVAMKLPPAPIPAKIDCTFVNFFSSDADNLSGSVLDSLVEAGILRNDSSSYVVSCSGTFAKTRKKRGCDRAVGILIRITPAEIEYVDLDVASIAPQSVA